MLSQPGPRVSAGPDIQMSDFGFNIHSDTFGDFKDCGTAEYLPDPHSLGSQADVSDIFALPTEDGVRFTITFLQQPENFLQDQNFWLLLEMENSTTVNYGATVVDDAVQGKGQLDQSFQYVIGTEDAVDVIQIDQMVWFQADVPGTPESWAFVVADFEQNVCDEGNDGFRFGQPSTYQPLNLPSTADMTDLDALIAYGTQPDRPGPTTQYPFSAVQDCFAFAGGDLTSDEVPPDAVINLSIADVNIDVRDEMKGTYLFVELSAEIREALDASGTAAQVNINTTDPVGQPIRGLTVRYQNGHYYGPPPTNIKSGAAEGYGTAPTPAEAGYIRQLDRSEVGAHFTAAPRPGAQALSFVVTATPQTFSDQSGCAPASIP